MKAQYDIYQQPRGCTDTIAALMLGHLQDTLSSLGKHRAFVTAGDAERASGRRRGAGENLRDARYAGMAEAEAEASIRLWRIVAAAGYAPSLPEDRRLSIQRVASTADRLRAAEIARRAAPTPAEILTLAEFREWLAAAA